MSNYFNETQKTALLKVIGILFVMFIASMYHRHETQKWPFDGQAVAQELKLAKEALRDANSQIFKEQTGNAILLDSLNKKQTELNEAKVAIMLKDTMQNIINENAVMSKELELVKAHSSEVVELVKAHKSELVTKIDGIYSDDDKRDHELAKSMVEVSKEYAKKSGLCCGKEEKPKPTVNKFEFQFEGLAPIPEQKPELPFVPELRENGQSFSDPNFIGPLQPKTI